MSTKKLALGGFLLVVLSLVFGMSTAMTLAPSETDKAIVVFSMLGFLCGLGLLVSSLIKYIMSKMKSHGE